MKLPAIITDLVNAQNSQNSAAYADCFTTDATVFDEGHDHHGKEEIKVWIESATAKYQTVMEPIEYSESGSPIMLKYNMEIVQKLIRSLKITG
jgi:ketosteroid isomerase-like protein